MTDMLDPFQYLFNQASQNGLRLNNFFQTCDGVFRANWRRDHLAPPANCSEFVESTAPYHALKDSLCVAIKTLPVATPVAVVVEDDLFGGL